MRTTATRTMRTFSLRCFWQHALPSFIVVGISVLLPFDVVVVATTWVNRPEDVPRAREQIFQQLKQTYFDQLRKCCEQLNQQQQANGNGQLDCGTLADPNVPVKALLFMNGGGKAEGNVKRFFYKCLAHEHDQRACCERSGVSFANSKLEQGDVLEQTVRLLRHLLHRNAQLNNDGWRRQPTAGGYGTATKTAKNSVMINNWWWQWPMPFALNAAAAQPENINSSSSLWHQSNSFQHSSSSSSTFDFHNNLQQCCQKQLIPSTKISGQQSAAPPPPPIVVAKNCVGQKCAVTADASDMSLALEAVIAANEIGMLNDRHKNNDEKKSAGERGGEGEMVTSTPLHWHQQQDSGVFSNNNSSDDSNRSNGLLTSLWWPSPIAQTSLTANPCAGGKIRKQPTRRTPGTLWRPYEMSH